MTIDLGKLDQIQADFEKNIPAIRKLQATISEKQAELDGLVAKLSPEVRALLDGQRAATKPTREAGQRTRLTNEQTDQLKTIVGQVLKGKKLGMGELVNEVNKHLEWEAKDTQVRNVLKSDSKRFKSEGERKNTVWTIKG